MRDDDFSIKLFLFFVVVVGAIFFIRSVLFKAPVRTVPEYVQKYLECEDLEGLNSHDSTVYQNGYVAGFEAAVEYVDEWIYGHANSAYYDIWEDGFGFGYETCLEDHDFEPTPRPVSTSMNTIVYYNKVSKVYHAIFNCPAINTAFTQYRDTVAAVTLLGYTPCPRCIK